MQALVAVTLTPASGLPADKMVNTFCFEYPGAQAPAQDALISTAIIAFYNTTAAGAAKEVAKHINDTVSRTASACRLDFYNITGHLDGSPHGSPYLTAGWTLSSSEMAGAGLPAEVAIVSSFHAAYGSLSEEVGNTRPKNRRRGRVYIGPLTLQVLGQDATTKRVKVVQSTMTDIQKASQAMMDDSNTNWCVWSRQDQLTLSVVGGHVDDGFDTQRRRGEKAISRSTYGI
jgi:hypothetical protein